MKKCTIFIFVFLLSCSVFLYGCAEKQLTEKAPVLVESEGLTESSISTELLELMDDHAERYKFSGSAIVIKDGEILLSKGYGMADITKQIPNKPQTIFRVGSLTKQFTASAIMLLDEKGMLSIQDTLDKYVPGYPEGANIKLVNLLTHTSGIQEYTALVDSDLWGKYYSPEDIIKTFKDVPLKFNPDEKYSYSNSNYILLGYIIEKVSGMKYEEYMKKNIFEPLDMKSTGFDYENDTTEDVAIGYSTISPEVVEAIPVDLSFPYAAGALQTTIEDLYKWDQVLYTSNLLKEDTIKEMFTPYMSKYGYGWWIASDKVVEHPGEIPGFTAHIKRNIEKKYTIILLSNNEQYSPNIIISKIEKLLE